MSDILAVPDGAKLKVTVNDVETRSCIDGVDVFPVQPEPVDQDTEPPNFLKGPFADRPFQMNENAYKGRARPGEARRADSSARCATSTSAACRSRPRSTTPPEELVLLNSVDVTSSFEGGAETFSDELN